AITVSVLCVVNSMTSVSPNAHAPYVQNSLSATGWHRKLITLLLEGGNIYWATADGNSNMTCAGWEDDI
ncbi:MAG TPA: hypothetical protein VE028_00240, partial [Nitratidesulfovibrio sp.]|nr:hypothetical protein [Nitratidesulfovibrio sp.]